MILIKFPNYEQVSNFCLKVNVKKEFLNFAQPSSLQVELTPLKLRKFSFKLPKNFVILKKFRNGFTCS